MWKREMEEGMARLGQMGSRLSLIGAKHSPTKGARDTEVSGRAPCVRVTMFPGFEKSVYLKIS